MRRFPGVCGCYCSPDVLALWCPPVRPLPRRSAAPDREPAPSPLVIEDQALVARVRAGDSAAFEALFRQSYDPMCAFVDRYVRVREDARVAGASCERDVP